MSRRRQSSGRKLDSKEDHRDSGKTLRRWWDPLTTSTFRSHFKYVFISEHLYVQKVTFSFKSKLIRCKSSVVLQCWCVCFHVHMVVFCPGGSWRCCSLRRHQILQQHQQWSPGKLSDWSVMVMFHFINTLCNSVHGLVVLFFTSSGWRSSTWCCDLQQRQTSVLLCWSLHWSRQPLLHHPEDKQMRRLTGGNVKMSCCDLLQMFHRSSWFHVR